MSKAPGFYSFLTSFILFNLALAFFPFPGRAEANSSRLPFSVRVVLAKADRLMNNKNYDKAITLLTSFQTETAAESAKIPRTATNKPEDKDRRHVEIYYALGTCYLMQNDYRQAANILGQAVKHDASHLFSWLNLAKASYELRDYSQAADCFANAYDLSPDHNPEYLHYSAVAYLLAQQYQPSIAAFERLFAKHPEKIQPAWRENLVHALLSTGKTRRALPHIRQLAEQYRDEKQIQWQEILLQQYMQLDMRKEALAYADALAKQAPTEPKWWKALASIHLQSGKYQPALAAMLIDSFLEPLSEQESKLVADLYLQVGIPAKAADLYQVILQAKNTPQLLERLILALRRQGQTKEALAVLEKFDPTGKVENLLMQKADLLYELGKYRMAAEVYQKTAEKDSRQKNRALKMAQYAMLQASYTNNSRQQPKQTITF